MLNKPTLRYVQYAAFCGYLQVSNVYPEMVRPKFYRFAIYLADTSNDNVLSLLDHLRSTKLVGGRVTLKLDSTTQEGRFGSYGDQKISKAIYRITKFNIQKQYVGKDDRRYYKFIEGILKHTYTVHIQTVVLRDYNLLYSSSFQCGC